MGALSPAKAGLLRMLIDSAPDSVLRKLEHALSDDAVRDGPLGSVWLLVEREAQDRAFRNMALAPILGMFSGPMAQFPPGQLGKLWGHLKTAYPGPIALAEMSARAYNPEDVDPASFDALCLLAADDLRAAERPAALAGFDAERILPVLDLAPIVRRCLPHLGEWLARMDQERRAAARLAYRDSVTVAPDAGPLFFQMLASRLAEPGQILRIISAVMDRPSERYLASSELGPFGVMLLDSIDDHLAVVRGFDTGGGEAAGRAAGQAVHRASIANDEAAFRVAAARACQTRPGAYETDLLTYLWRCMDPLKTSPFHMQRSYVANVVKSTQELKRHLFNKQSNVTPPPHGVALLNRLQFGFFSVLARLDAVVDYAGLQRELLASVRS